MNIILITIAAIVWFVTGWMGTNVMTHVFTHKSTSRDIFCEGFTLLGPVGLVVAIILLVRWGPGPRSPLSHCPTTTSPQNNG